MGDGPAFQDSGVVSEKILKLDDLKDGDHLAVMGETKKITYFHHGILTSRQKAEVVHFSGETKSKAEISTIDLLQFMGINKNLYRVNYTAALTPEKTVETALKFLSKDEETWEKYGILSNNCEHFATCCKTGIKYSEQASNFIRDSIKKVYAEVGSPIDKPF